MESQKFNELSDEECLTLIAKSQFKNIALGHDQHSLLARKINRKLLAGALFADRALLGRKATSARKKRKLAREAQDEKKIRQKCLNDCTTRPNPNFDLCFGNELMRTGGNESRARNTCIGFCIGECRGAHKCPQGRIPEDWLR